MMFQRIAFGWKAAGLGALCCLATANAYAAQDDATIASSDAPQNALQQLAAKGVFIRANLLDQYATNPRGGVHQGRTNVGQFNIGADLDLQKLLGFDGSSFHFTVYRDYGNGLQHDVSGTFSKQQYVYKNEYPRWHLGLFAWEQKFLDNRLDVIFGRLGTTAYYTHLAINCQFQAGTTCGVPRIINSEAGYSLLPSATWAMNVNYKLTPHSYIEGGVYEVNPTTQPSNGLDFSIANSTGVTFPVEWSWSKMDPVKDPYGFEIKAGGYVTTAPLSDPYYNTQGRSRGLYGGTAREADSHRAGIYAMADHIVWRPSPGSSRNLNLFLGVVHQLETDEIMRRQIYTGFVFTGPFAQRPVDTVGLSISYFRMTDAEQAYLDDARKKAGGTGKSHANQLAFELNYGWKPTPGIVLMPNIQYIIHPDNSAIPATKTVPKNLVVYGLSMTVNISRLFGLRAPAVAE
ncbi:carbohydrate porin [Luteibacter aegosomaticola]|uniref:carbohydrate porin n=1 Tax=Luteibacter aegosomaticola TaxID=2911538 RepID=UPI001FFA556D|nr:carbohydrate porin [Luteibacter aegosomaticola]UPG92105.1 carbohydrate porin [Luteibacter aegosomaticola]